MPSLEDWIERDLGQSTKPLDPLVRRIVTTWQATRRAEKTGDLATLSISLSQLITVREQILPHLENAISVATAYDIRKYLDDQFDSEFRCACAAKDLPVEGQFPRYLVYPLRIQVDQRRMGILINQKFHRGLRPSQIVEAIGSERAHVISRSFNARYFLADLAAAYDSCIELESAKNRVSISGHEVGLRNVYRRLVPMRQWRADYPETFFAFDLHRLFQTGQVDVPDGRRLHLAPARQARLNIAVLDGSGRETQLGLVAFRKD